MEKMKLSELKAKSPAELLVFAEEYEVENASTMRKQELMFAILKELAAREIEIVGEGVVEVLHDGFGFLRSPDANYLPGPDDIYVSPSQIRRFSLRTGDTVEGEIRSPKEGERYFALLKVATISARWPLPIGATISMTRADRSLRVGSPSSRRKRSSGNSGVRLSKLTLCRDFSGFSKFSVLTLSRAK